MATHRRRFGHLLAVCAIVAFVQKAHGTGATGHMIAGIMVVDLIEDPTLKRILTRHQGAFLSGTTFPDAVLKHLQAGDKLTASDADRASHGRPQPPSQPPGGLAANVWAAFWKACPDGPTNAGCEEKLAFFMGIVTHMVTDGPWHAQFNDKTVGQCDACLSSMTSSGDSKYCHPGGEKVLRDGSNDVVGDGRHGVIDTDLDLCFSAAWMGRRDDIKPVAQNPLLLAPGTRTGAAAVGLCPSGSFFDPRDGGECWQCPSGTTRTPFPVKDANACTTPPKETFRRATKVKKIKAQMPPDTCGKGTFWDGKGGDGILGACYHCGDYNRTGYAIDDNKGRACSRVGVELTSASFIKKATVGNCPTGQSIGLDGGCYSCPAGFTPGTTNLKGQFACVKEGVLACSKLGALPPNLPKTIPLPPTDPVLYGMLSEALRLDGHKVSVDVIVRQVGLFAAIPRVESEPTLAKTIVTPAGPVCSGAISNGLTATGALRDSAKESAKFVNALWKHRNDKANVSVIRTDTFEYQVVKAGKTLHRSWTKNCSLAGVPPRRVTAVPGLPLKLPNPVVVAPGPIVVDADDRTCVEDRSVPNKTSSQRVFDVTRQRAGDVVAFYSPEHRKFLRFKPESGCQVVDASISPTARLPLQWTMERFKVTKTTVSVTANKENMPRLYEAYAFFNRTGKNGCFLRMNDKAALGSHGDYGGALPDDWAGERFRIIKAGGGLVGLWSDAHRRYVQIKADGTTGAGPQLQIGANFEPPPPGSASERLLIIWP